MKLRNKKTGEHGDYKVISAGYLIRVKDCNSDETWQYDCLAGFIDKWEDYKPTEPLIKDPKIRKAVRVWAEVNDVKKVTVEKDFSTYAFYPADTDRVSISIWTEPSLSNLSRGNVYTIEELCGEEE